jgi:hypothetical protein
MDGATIRTLADRAQQSKRHGLVDVERAVVRVIESRLKKTA